TNIYTLSLHDALPIYINIFDDAEVLWAVATRSRWDRDLVVIPNMITTTRDPTAYAGSPGDLSYHAYTVAKGGIDATMPASPEPRSEEHTSELQSRFDI